MSVTFWAYLPFGEPVSLDRVHVVFYHWPPGADRRRVGSLDLPVEAAEEFADLWTRGGGGILTREDLDIPGPFPKGT